MPGAGSHLRGRGSPRLAAAALSGSGRVLIGALSALLVTPFALRALGPERFGLWALAGSLIGLLRLLDLGQGRALSRTVARDGAAAAPALATGRSLAWLIGLGGLALISLLRPFLSSPRLGVPPHLAGEAGWVLLGTAAVAALEGLFAPGQAALEGLGRLARLNLIDTVIQRLLSPWLVLPVLLAGGGLMGLVVKNAAVALLAGLWIQRELARAAPQLAGLRPGGSPTQARRLLTYGIQAQAVNLSAALVEPLAQAFVGASSGLGALSAYALAGRLANQAAAACMAALQALFPLASALGAASEAARDGAGGGAAAPAAAALRALHARARAWLDPVLLPAAALGLALGPAFCGLWLGPPVDAAVARLLPLLAVGWLPALLALPAFLLQQAGGRTSSSTTAGLLGAAVSILGAYLGRGSGPSGVALGVSAGLAAGALATAFAARRDLGLGPGELLPGWRALAAALPAALASRGLLAALAAGAWWSLALAALGGAAAAAVWLRLSGAWPGRRVSDLAERG